MLDDMVDDMLRHWSITGPSLVRHRSVNGPLTVRHRSVNGPSPVHSRSVIGPFAGLVGFPTARTISEAGNADPLLVHFGLFSSSANFLSAARGSKIRRVTKECRLPTR
jgi:hypothetical protein